MVLVYYGLKCFLDGDEYYGYGYRLQTSETLPNFHLAKRITLNGGILPSKMGNNFTEPEKKGVVSVL